MRLFSIIPIDISAVPLVLVEQEGDKAEAKEDSSDQVGFFVASRFLTQCVYISVFSRIGEACTVLEYSREGVNYCDRAKCPSLKTGKCLFVGSCLNSQNLTAKQNQLSAQNGKLGLALENLGKNRSTCQHNLGSRSVEI